MFLLFETFFAVLEKELTFPTLNVLAPSQNLNMEYMQIPQEKYSDKALPKIIQKYGGLEDHVVDVFGFKKQICGAKSSFDRVV